MSSQFKVASTRRGRPISVPLHPSEKALLTEDRQALPLSTPLTSRATDGVTFSQRVFRAPQYFRSSETQAARDSCLARQFIFSVISFDSSMSMTVEPRESLKMPNIVSAYLVHSNSFSLSPLDVSDVCCLKWVRPFLVIS